MEAIQSKWKEKPHCIPVNKAGRKLDLMGRRFYSSAALAICVSNYRAAAAAYQQLLWERMESLIAAVPEDHRNVAILFQHEAHTLAVQPGILQVALQR